MCPRRVRLLQNVLWFVFFLCVGFFFLSLSHPDKVQCSGTVLIESCAAGSLSSCRTDEWDKIFVH